MTEPDPAPAPVGDGAAVDPDPPDGGDAAPRRGVRALTAADFSFADAIGGVRGLVESVAPGAVFVVLFVLTDDLAPPLVASLAVALLLVGVRLGQRQPITQAVSGVIGVAIGVVWAWRTGEAGDYYLPGLFISGGYLLACLVSLLVRWPLVGLVVGLLRGQPTAWRQDPGLVRRAQWATWVWVAMFGSRLVVQVPLYLADEVAVLGTVRLVMGVPLWAVTLWVTWLLVRHAMTAPPSTERPAEPSSP